MKRAGSVPLHFWLGMHAGAVSLYRGTGYTDLQKTRICMECSLTIVSLHSLVASLCPFLALPLATSFNGPEALNAFSQAELMLARIELRFPLPSKQE